LRSPTSIVELRVFISSTFSDLHAEREHLVKRVFPEIRALCRDRGITFTEVDLRWGLTEEEGALGRIVRTCLEEVDHCRPYFMGMIGNRYGWVPGYHELHMDPLLLAKYPWIEEFAADGVSLTELEFIHGVFNVHDAERTGAFFYQRTSDVHDADDPARLTALIERARDTGCPFREFLSPDELGQLVHEDLVGLIEREWPEVDTPSPLETERRKHRAYSASRILGYIPNPTYIDAISRWLATDDVPLVITGSSGLGKSSLMAFIGSSRRRGNPDALIIEYYVGASDSTGSATDLMRYVIDRIREHYQLDEKAPSADEELAGCFAEWLHAASRLSADAGSSVVILLDALNQLNDEGRTLAWLPQSIPASTKLVVSTTPGDVADLLTKRSWSRLVVSPVLDERVRQSIVVRYLGEFHKGISAEKLQRIIADPKAESPLYLRVVAEELRLHGMHETLDSVIDTFVDAQDLPAVFDALLQRVERDYGRASVGELTSLIAASRSGLSESDLLDLTGLTRLDLSQLLFAFDYHLIHRDGLLGFHHDYMRQAVRRRYLMDELDRKRLHGRIAGYFATKACDRRRLHEEPWGWRQAEELDRLKACLSEVAMFSLFATLEDQYELVGYWRFLRDSFDIVETYRTMIEDCSDLDDEERLHVMRAVCRFYVAADLYEAAETQLLTVLAGSRQLYGDTDLRTIAVLEELGEALYHQGKYQPARDTWEDVLRSKEAVLGVHDPQLCTTLDALASVMYYLNDIDTSERLCRRSLDLIVAEFGTDHVHTVDRLTNLAALLHTRSDHDGAIELADRAARNAEAGWGVRDVRTARVMRILAVHYEKSGNLPLAEDLHRRALAILEPLLGLHMLVADSLADMAATLAQLGKLDEAEECYRRARNIDLDLLGEEHIRTINISLGYGRVLGEQGRYDEALTLYRRYLPLKRGLLGAAHPGYLKSASIYIRMLRLAGQCDEAAALSEELGLDVDGTARASS